VISGHAREAYAPILDGIAPGSLTLVVLMGVRTRAAIAAHLVQRGWRANTPAAIIHGASQPDAITWTGTLDTLGAASFETDLPAVIVIGDVVALSTQIRTHASVTHVVEEKSV
jgi:uroporphyrin-III C-methyltransferase/precorrin-2 dehydrogenase/sirohydrochlorin ferrochelatase